MEWWAWVILIFLILVWIGSKAEEDEKNKNKTDGQSPSKNKTDTGYSKVVPEMLAVCIAANDKISDKQINMAVDIIENDDMLSSTERAIQSLHENVEKMHEGRIKSFTVLKLRATTITHELKKLRDKLQKDRITVMLDGMLDFSNNQKNERMIKLIDEFKSAVTTSVSSDSIYGASDNINQPTEKKAAGSESSNKKKTGSSALKYAATAAAGAMVGNAIANSNTEEEHIEVIEETTEPENLESNFESDTTTETPIEDIEDDIEDDYSGDDDGGIFDIFGD